MKKNLLSAFLNLCGQAKGEIMACDCCGDVSTWKQKVGGEILNLCEEHHTILRIKVHPEIDIETDKDVLTWLKKQPPNHHKVVKYGIFIIGRRTLRG